jgi:hypothetical protein
MFIHIENVTLGSLAEDEEEVSLSIAHQQMH